MVNEKNISVDKILAFGDYNYPQFLNGLLNKEQHRDKWIKESNIDKIMGVEKQRQVTQNTNAINHTKVKDMDLEM